MSAQDKGVSQFPREYNESMGITHRQYMTLRLKARQLFGSEENLDKAYGNIPEDLLRSTKSTKEQVLWAYEEYLLDQSYHAKMVPVKNSSEENAYTFKDEKIKNTLNTFDDLFKEGVVHEGIAEIVSEYKNGNISQIINDELNGYKGIMSSAKSIVHPKTIIKGSSRIEPCVEDEPNVCIAPNTGNDGR